MSAHKAKLSAQSFLMASCTRSGVLPQVPGEVSSFGYAISETGKLALSEVVGDYVGGVTLPPGVLDALLAVVARALIARDEESDYECARCGDTGGCWPARCAANETTQGEAERTASKDQA